MQNFFRKVVSVRKNVPHPVGDVNNGVIPEILFEVHLSFESSDEVLLEVLENASCRPGLKVLLVWLLLGYCLVFGQVLLGFLIIAIVSLGLNGM